MNHANRLWVQRIHMGDFAPEADDQPIDLQSARLLGRWHSPAHAYSTALERALSDLAAQDIPDGLFPWAAHEAQQNGWSGQHWGQLHLCHWNVSNGLVSLMDPEWPEPDALAQLWRELAAFVADAGLVLMRSNSAHACVHGEALRDLPTAAFDKVMGRPIGAFLPESNDIRRLQSELQMWFYTHPLLQSMARPINSVWLSATGSIKPQLSALLDQVHTAQPTTPPQPGDRWLCSDDTHASLWQVAGAHWGQRLWRRWRPVTLWSPGHEMD